MSYNPNVAYLPGLLAGGEAAVVEWGVFSYFPPLKPRYVLWSRASYSPKNMVNLLKYTRILSSIVHTFLPKFLREK